MISFAHAADLPASTTDFLGGFAPLILILVVFWFLIMRPQQKKMKAHQKMLSELKRGDKVITGSGILGKITKISETNPLLTVEIAEGVEIQIERSAISALYDPAVALQNQAGNAKNN